MESPSVVQVGVAGTHSSTRRRSPWEHVPAPPRGGTCPPQRAAARRHRRRRPRARSVHGGRGTRHGRPARGGAARLHRRRRPLPLPPPRDARGEGGGGGPRGWCRAAAACKRRCRGGGPRGRDAQAAAVDEGACGSEGGGRGRWKVGCANPVPRVPPFCEKIVCFSCERTVTEKVCAVSTSGWRLVGDALPTCLGGVRLGRCARS